MQQTEPRSRHVLKLRAFVDTLAAVGAEKLVRALGVSSNDAQLAMLDVANSICAAYKGQTFYVPAGVSAFNSAKHDAIRLAYSKPAASVGASKPFSGQRVEELARDFELSERMVRNVVSARQTENARAQLRTE